MSLPNLLENTFLSGAATDRGLVGDPGSRRRRILRYRLFDIDRLISRTLVTGPLTASVLLLYVLVVGH